MSRRRALKILGLCLSVALIGAGADAVLPGLGGLARELQRPDLLVACGVCVAVWIGGAPSSEEATPEA